MPAPDLIGGGYRFSDKDMRKCKKRERIPIQFNRDALYRAGSTFLMMRLSIA